MNHALLMWTSLAVFGTLAGGRAVLAVRAAPGLPLSDLFAAMAALVVVGGSLVALRDPDRFEPSPPWIAYVAAAGTLAYVVSLVVERSEGRPSWIEPERRPPEWPLVGPSFPGMAWLRTHNG